MISSFRIKDFKSFEDAELKVGTLTLLVGANASGKSNAIEAIRLLSWIAKGRSLDTLPNHLKQDIPIFRGNIEDLILKSKGDDAFSLGCRTPDRTWDSLNISFQYSVDNGLWLQAEDVSASNSSEYLYKSFNSNTDFITVSHTDFKSISTKTEIQYSSRRAVFSQIIDRLFVPINELNNYLQDPCTMLQFRLEHVYFFDSVPSRMRGYSNKSDSILSPNAENISSVLYNLLENSPKSENPKSNLLNFISSLPEQNISDIRFWKTERGEVMIKLVETFGGTEVEIDAVLLSDGTLRVLSIAAALLSAPEGSLVIIEEIDNGVHPSRAKSLLNSIKEIAERRHLKVLISSHNPALMDALPDSSLGDTVFCYRDPKTGFSKLQRLSDLFDYPELIVQGSLGDLVTEGILDRFVKNHPSPGEKRKKMHEWIESIR